MGLPTTDPHQQLVDMGFDPNRIQEALEASNGDVNQAANLLSGV